ncbi:ig-like domain-containing protein [Trichonephila clavipes]|nr:ig-like domain-containing protein [Trichonephila clavipes]
MMSPEGCENDRATFRCSGLASRQGLSTGLKFVQLDIPGALHSGESTWLKCQYELGVDELYSVKWYKNNVEFFRYLPSDMPAGQNYELLGVYVDLPRSNATHVYLYKTDLNTEGTYGCEVSTEAPSFRTVKADKELRIYGKPKQNPNLIVRNHDRRSNNATVNFLRREIGLRPPHS